MLLSSTIASLAALAGGVAAWSELDPPASHFHLRDVMQETVRLPLTRRSPTIKRADGSFDLSQMETEMSWVVGKYEANARALHLFGGSEANPDTRMKARTVADLTYVQSGGLK
ncbi:hypothetical protein MNV49_007921 [Pseudohyphozyma bogoriensis]|nr:hypothetical protein MNV49_007921 [Pseudohyphozyma bogoriensis]